MPWTKVARTNMKVVARNKLTTSNTRQLEPVTTSQPTDEEATDEVVDGKGSIRFALPSAYGNRTRSKWGRRLLTRAKRKQANFSMWEEVKKKWREYQEASKTKAVQQEVEQISETVNLM